MFFFTIHFLCWSFVTLVIGRSCLALVILTVTDIRPLDIFKKLNKDLNIHKIDEISEGKRVLKLELDEEEEPQHGSRDYCIT